MLHEIVDCEDQDWVDLDKLIENQNQEEQGNYQIVKPN